VRLFVNVLVLQGLEKREDFATQLAFGFYITAVRARGFWAERVEQFFVPLLSSIEGAGRGSQPRNLLHAKILLDPGFDSPREKVCNGIL
jgi:hypothetical protein